MQTVTLPLDIDRLAATAAGLDAFVEANVANGRGETKGGWETSAREAAPMLAHALLGGRMRATVVSSKTGRHISVTATAKRYNGKRWEVVPLADADVVYLDVPRPDGPGSPIGSYRVRDGRYGNAGTIAPPRGADGFDTARIWAACYVLRAALGEPVNGAATVLVGASCSRCNANLDQPESIVRGMGPTCFDKPTQGTHVAPRGSDGMVVPERTTTDSGEDLGNYNERKLAEREIAETATANGEDDLVTVPSGADPRTLL